MEINILLLASIILTGAFSLYVLFYFFMNFNRTVYHEKWVYVAGFITVFIITSIINLFMPSASIPLTLMIIVALGHFLFNKEKIYIVYYSIFTIFYMAFQLIFINLITVVFTYFNSIFYSPELMSIAINLLFSLSSLIIVRIFIFLFNKRKIKDLKRVDYLSLFIVPLFSVFYIFNIMSYIQLVISIEELMFFIINLFSILFLNIFIVHVFEKISKNNELEKKVLLYEQKSQMEYKYYSDLELKHKESNKVIHDIKNHMQSIEGLYEIGESNKAKSYVDDIYKLLNNLGNKLYSKNSVLNIIINHKAKRAEKSNIKIYCEIEEVSLDFIDSMDLTTIFSNLLDNAIEELENIEGQRVIELKIRKFNSFLAINISNKTTEKKLRKDGKLKSTKENHRGLGVRNVKRAVKKYDGDFNIEIKNSLFIVNIIIPVID